MREIKFRAWDKAKKVMWTWGKSDCKLWLNEENQSQGFPLSAFLELEFADLFELMQYTGLKDKNGVEIYEGDIIRGIYGKYPQNWRVDKLSAYGVTFTRLTIPPISAPYFYRDMRHTDQWEVIGNIYENKDLLK